MHPTNPRFGWWATGAAVLALIPPALLLFLILRYGVDVPVQDQWDGIAPLLEKADAGTLTLGDFFALHNEHRHAFPRLALLALAEITHWNVRAELVLNWALLVATGLNVMMLARRTGWAWRGCGPVLVALASAFLFSPQQHENLLWGFQAGFLMPLVWVTALSWMVPAAGRPACAFALAGVLPLLATYSIASGMLAWPIAACLLALHRHVGSWRHARWAWLVWSLVAAACVGGYFVGYRTPAHHVPPSASLHAPLALIRYFFTCVGVPLGRWQPATSLMAGAAVVALVIAAVSWVLRRRSEHCVVDTTVPWLLLAGFALGQAALTAIGRSWMGESSALASRYVSTMMFVPLGLLFVAGAYLRERRADTRPGARFAAAAVVAVIATIAGAAGWSAWATLPGWPVQRETRLHAKAAVQLCRIPGSAEMLAALVHTPPALIQSTGRSSERTPPVASEVRKTLVEANAARLREQIEFLHRLNFLRPGLVARDSLPEIAAPGPSTDESGVIDWFNPSPGATFTLAGWACIPGQDRAADAVLVTYDNLAGKPILLFATPANLSRSREAQQRSPAPQPRSSWISTLPLAMLPPYPTSLRAWSYDAENGAAHALTSVIPPSAIEALRSQAGR